jgi:hypothetical protein
VVWGTFSQNGYQYPPPISPALPSGSEIFHMHTSSTCPAHCFTSLLLQCPTAWDSYPSPYPYRTIKNFCTIYYSPNFICYCCWWTLCNYSQLCYGCWRSSLAFFIIIYFCVACKVTSDTFFSSSSTYSGTWFRSFIPVHLDSLFYIEIKRYLCVWVRPAPANVYLQKLHHTPRWTHFY